MKGAGNLVFRYFALILFIQMSWTRKHVSMDLRLGTTGLEYL